MQAVVPSSRFALRSLGEKTRSRLKTDDDHLNGSRYVYSTIARLSLFSGAENSKRDLYRRPSIQIDAAQEMNRVAVSSPPSARREFGHFERTAGRSGTVRRLSLAPPQRFNMSRSRTEAETMPDSAIIKLHVNCFLYFLLEWPLKSGKIKRKEENAQSSLTMAS